MSCLGRCTSGQTREFFSYLNCVAKVLKRGGLYLLTGVARFDIVARHEERWTMKRRGIMVRTVYRPELVDPLEQTCIEHLILDVDNHGKRLPARASLSGSPSLLRSSSR